MLCEYGIVHVLAAVADARRFLDDHGTEYAGEAAVFCHALGLFGAVLLGPPVAIPMNRRVETRLAEYREG